MASPNPPYHDPFVVAANPMESKKIPALAAGKAWLRWFGTLVQNIDSAPVRKTSVRLVDQAATIPITPIPMESLSPGLYRVSFYSRITQAGTVSSSLKVTISWTDKAQALSLDGDTLVGNAVTEYDFGTAVIRVDAASAISYTATYAASAAASMLYDLSITVEALALVGES